MVIEKTKSLFELLRNKQIIEILDGDERFGMKNDVYISMPYLSGNDIVNISRMFGMDATYCKTKSRWEYFDDLLEYCIVNDNIGMVLEYLFSVEQFKGIFYNKTPDEIEETYNHIIKIVMEKINGILYFSGNKLVSKHREYYIIPISSDVLEIEVSTIKGIDREYIKDISDRAIQDILNDNYDSAITKSRTLLEEVFCYLIEKKNENPSAKGDIGKMYRQVRSLYNMHIDKNMDIRIKKLLSGLETIVSSIAEMRNANSDSHGVGSRRVNIAEHHARLFVNASMTMADFIISVGNNNMNL